MPLIYQNREHYDSVPTHRPGLLTGGAYGIQGWGVSKHLAACPQGCTSRKRSVSSCSHPPCLIFRKATGTRRQLHPLFSNFSFLFPHPAPGAVRGAQRSHWSCSQYAGCTAPQRLSSGGHLRFSATQVACPAPNSISLLLDH